MDTLLDFAAPILHASATLKGIPSMPMSEPPPPPSTPPSTRRERTFMENAISLRDFLWGRWLHGSAPREPTAEGVRLWMARNLVSGYGYRKLFDAMEASVGKERMDAWLQNTVVRRPTKDV